VLESALPDSSYPSQRRPQSFSNQLTSDAERVFKLLSRSYPRKGAKHFFKAIRKISKKVIVRKVVSQLNLAFLAISDHFDKWDFMILGMSAIFLSFILIEQLFQSMPDGRVYLSLMITGTLPAFIDSNNLSVPRPYPLGHRINLVLLKNSR